MELAQVGRGNGDRRDRPVRIVLRPLGSPMLGVFLVCMSAVVLAFAAASVACKPAG